MKVKTHKLLALAALVVAAASAAEAQLGRTVDAGGGLYLQQSFDRALIREPSGAASELELPPGTGIYRLEQLAGGWIVTGELDALGSSDLLLLRSDNGARALLPAPLNAEQHLLRSNPVPLVERGELVGLAWIAGPTVIQSAVYASLWSGADWSLPELVSPPGAGTQIGLAGAVLTDGSWLLVWSAYDGSDDEIVWSRRYGGSWSTPRRLHPANDKPDIVPSVIATGRGALAAWSSSDGTTYRVRLAGFEDGAWSELGFTGPRGSFHPTLTPGEESVLLLYRTVLPQTWTLLELDGGGEPLRRAAVATDSTFRPGLAPPAGPAPAFEWPGVEVASPLRVEAEWQSEP